MEDDRIDVGYLVTLLPVPGRRGVCADPNHCCMNTDTHCKWASGTDERRWYGEYGNVGSCAGDTLKVWHCRSTPVFASTE